MRALVCAVVLAAFAPTARAGQFMPYAPVFASDTLRSTWASRVGRARHVRVVHAESRLRAASFRSAVPCEYRIQVLHADERVDGDTTLVGFLVAAIRRAAPNPGLRNTCTDSLGRDEITFVPEDAGERLEISFTPGKGILTITDATGRTATDRLGTRSAELLSILARALPDDLRLDAIVPCAAAIDSEVVAESLPEAKKKVPPDYADEALESGIQGTVLVLALVGANGRVTRTVVRDSAPPLDAGAVRAVEQWRFEPARSQGRPVPAWIAVPVKFTID